MQGQNKILQSKGKMTLKSYRMQISLTSLKGNSIKKTQSSTLLDPQTQRWLVQKVAKTTSS